MKVFFDSNIFLYHLFGNYPKATHYIELVESGVIQGYISDIVYSEVILGYLRAQSNLNTHTLCEKLPYLDENSEDLSPLFSLFINIPTYIGNDIFEIIKLYHILPHDALISAVYKKSGVQKIVTNDKDFKRVPFLEIINKPIKHQKDC